MQTRFCTPTEINDLIQNDKIAEDLLRFDTIAICSIADLLHQCESIKKSGDIGNIFDCQNKCDYILNNESGPVKRGIVHIANLSQERLSKALFNFDSGIAAELWGQAANSEISPRRSIRYLSLRLVENISWWTEQVFEEMEDYNNAADD